MSLRLPRLALAAATLPLVLAAAAGCGSGDDSSSISVHLTMKSGGAGGMDAEGDADCSTTPPTTSLRTRSDQLDPRTMFDTFEKGITSVTNVGEEDVEGEPVSITAPPADQITTMPGM